MSIRDMIHDAAIVVVIGIGLACIAAYAISAMGDLPF